MWKKSIKEEEKKDKMFRFNFPERWFVIEAKNLDEAIKESEKIASKI